MSKHIALALLLVYLGLTLHAQKQVAITIDDIPNSVQGTGKVCYSPMLQTLDKLKIPIAIFVNEGKIYKVGESEGQGIKLLDEWIGRKYITVGNHTFGHTRYSAIGLDSFTADIMQGTIRDGLARKHGKSIKYFRFPFNDLGKDSLQHMQIKQYLEKNKYTIAPFTIENSDWAYNDVYEYWLNKNDSMQAARVGQEYILKTLAYFAYFENISLEQYGRPVKHIYLCHDNRLNAAYLPELVRLLKKEGYTFISLDKAMCDGIYRQEDRYYKKFGISWIYRWMSDRKLAMQYLKGQPDVDTIEHLRDSLMTLSGKND